SSPENCGGCGITCDAGQVCSEGVCTARCSNGLTQCGQGCIDTDADWYNCGGCGVRCQSGQACLAGLCTVTPTAPISFPAEETEASGCSCSVPGSQRLAAGGWLGALLVVGLGARRRLGLGQS